MQLFFKLQVLSDCLNRLPISEHYSSQYAITYSNIHLYFSLLGSDFHSTASHYEQIQGFIGTFAAKTTQKVYRIFIA